RRSGEVPGIGAQQVTDRARLTRPYSGGGDPEERGRDRHGECLVPGPGIPERMDLHLPGIDQIDLEEWRPREPDLRAPHDELLRFPPEPEKIGTAGLGERLSVHVQTR